MNSDGANVGYNPDTTTDRSICYIWHADKEGVYLFSDMADTRGNEQGTNVHSLFGAIIVEAAGSSWSDPVTPILRAYVGDPSKIRLIHGGVKETHVFHLHNHQWRLEPDDPFTRIIPVQGAVSVGNVFNIEPERTNCPGDYLYRSGSLKWDVESGMWGILRVSGRNIKCRCESICRSVKRWWEKKWYEK